MEEAGTDSYTYWSSKQMGLKPWFFPAKKQTKDIFLAKVLKYLAALGRFLERSSPEYSDQNDQGRT